MSTAFASSAQEIDRQLVKRVHNKLSRILPLFVRLQPQRASRASSAALAEGDVDKAVAVAQRINDLYERMIQTYLFCIRRL